MVIDTKIRKMLRGTSITAVKKGSRAFIQNERSGYIYPNALKLVQNNSSDISKITEGISNLLSGWHNSFYRFGPFSTNDISKYITSQQSQLKRIRKKNIRNVIVDNKFESLFRTVYDGCLDATASTNAKFTRKTVTGTSKALCLLAPGLFPMCDEAISQAYDCWWVYSDGSFWEYLKFFKYMKILAEQMVAKYSKIHGISDLNKAEILLIQEIRTYSGDSYKYNKTLLKIIDEYNYAKFTKGWL